MSQLSLEIDKLIHDAKVSGENHIAEKFLEYMLYVEANIVPEWKRCRDEATRLHKELMDAQGTNNNLQVRLKNTRYLLEKEKNMNIILVQEKNNLENQIEMVCDLLSKGNATKEQLQVLSNTLGGTEGVKGGAKDLMSPNCLPTITEAATFGSILNISDFETTEDDLESSKTRSGRSFKSLEEAAAAGGHKRKSSPSRHGNGKRESSRGRAKKVKSSDNLKIIPETESGPRHFEPTAPPLFPEVEIENGRAPQTAVKLDFATPNINMNVQNPNTHTTPNQQMYRTASIQITTPAGSNYSPYQSPLSRNYSGSKVNLRPHSFVQKSIYWTEYCLPCDRRIKFGKVAYKCKDCRAVCHSDCRDNVPLPCIPSTNTPGNKEQKTSIADFAPRISPMVPAVVIHCTNEIEKRGLTEVGLYRVSGSEREMRELKQSFLRGKGTPNLSHIEIPVICATLKDFLRNLSEPLVTRTLWRDFIAATKLKEEQDSMAALYQVISDLPQPNRDTLAWMVFHLQRVAECTECKMPTSNLAKVFGPTIIGYSIPKPDPSTIFEETPLQQKVMESLLMIPSDYWSNFIHLNSENLNPSQAQTPEPPVRTLRRRSILSTMTLGQLNKNSQQSRNVKIQFTPRR